MQGISVLQLYKYPNTIILKTHNLSAESLLSHFIGVHKVCLPVLALLCSSANRNQPVIFLESVRPLLI